MASNNLLIFGASTRAAAFSALRAGFSPWCADLFADADLQIRCPVTQVLPARYPQQFRELARTDIFGPWMYTGGLENHPSLVHSIALQRTLLGNDQEETAERWHPVGQFLSHLTAPVGGNALGRARSPEFVVGVLSGADLPFAALFDDFPNELPSAGRWLIKPRKGAGGSGIRRWTGKLRASDRRSSLYLQEFVEGESCSAVYVGAGPDTRLLGVTQQLAGETRLHARPFQYCGNIGPLALPPAATAIFERLGRALAIGCGLRGLFGVDCMLAEGVPYPVEINPRYTASVEVLEHATGVAALALHCAAFDLSHRQGKAPPALGKGTVVGKAILFAWKTLIFPADGPWLDTLRHPGDIQTMPVFADIPRARQCIEAGQPILTLFASAGSVAECREELWKMARALETRLYGR